MPDHAAENSEVNPGARLRRIRRGRGLTLRALSSRTGLSESFLSQLERGQTNASIGSLRRIAEALGVRVADLFDPIPNSDRRCVPASQRPHLAFGISARKFLLASAQSPAFEAFIVEFDHDGSTGLDPYSHPGSEELIVLLRGAVAVQLNSDIYVLEEEGSSVWFHSELPHRIVNASSSRSAILWVIVPAVR